MPESFTSPFHPKQTATGDKSKVFETLRSFSKLLLLVACGLVPIIFIPSTLITQSSGKILVVFAILTISLFGYFLSNLKDGAIRFHFNLPLVGLWLVAITSLLSALFSHDLQDSLFGDSIDIYSVSFSVILALLATCMLILRKGGAILKLYLVLLTSGLILSLFHIARLFFGPEFLSFGIFNTVTSSPIGSWNSLAIFYGLVILLSLLALSQLPLTKISKTVSALVVALSLVLLSIINFSPVWWILAVSCLALFVLNIFGGSLVKNSSRTTKFTNIISICIAVVSILFIIFGSQLSLFVANHLHISYLEIRPSVSATLEVGKNVYGHNLLVGVGPNKFIDAWQLYKNQSINQTIFWNTPFDTGYSYVATSAVAGGLLTLLAWIFFLGSLIWYGIKFVLNAKKFDKFSLFIGSSSLIATIYLWLISAMYIPSSTILLLAAITTGVFVSICVAQLQTKAITLSASKGKVQSIILVGSVVVIVVACLYANYIFYQKISSVYHFNKAVSSITDINSLPEAENAIAAAFSLNHNDIFAREISFYRWSEMNSLLSVAEPTADDQQSFADSSSRAIEAALLAISLDPTEPSNYQLLGQIYTTLAIVGVDNAYEKAIESYDNALKFSPNNPYVYLLEANLEVQKGDLEKARQAAEKAVVLKPNYTDALFFLAQLDINDGNADSAIALVTSIVQLEPQNPTRRYQLGVLLASEKRLDEAISAFEQAVTIDPQYANAHYFLGLGYAEKGMTDKAIEELTIVRNLNENNTVVDQIINDLKKNGSTAASLTNENPISEREAAAGSVTDQDLESDLVTTSNPVVPNSETKETVQD